MIKRFDKQKGKLKRTISGIMAIVLVLTVAGTVTFVRTEETAAKETLDSITKVVNGLNYENPYKILEVVPDSVQFETELTDSRGKKHVVSGNQTMGFTGYYIAGQEPVRNDIDSMFNDQLRSERVIGDVKYTYIGSSVSDSNMRYELADKMFIKLEENGILLDSNRAPNPSTRRKSRSILEAPLFERDNSIHVDAYYEVREGEEGWSKDDFVIMEESGELERLIRDYDGTMKLKDESHSGETPVPFIDEAKGEMIPSISGNFIMSYDVSSMPEESKDIASDFVRSCLVDNIFEKNSLRYVSALNPDGTVNAEVLHTRRGDFDPKLDYVDQIYKEEHSVSANTSAVFAAANINNSASYGYIVTGWKIADTENIPVEGTPLYTYNGSYYVYAGRYGSIPGFTLSANSVSDNETPDNVTAHIETHLNSIALSKGDHIEESNDETLFDEDSLDDAYIIDSNEKLLDSNEKLLESDELDLITDDELEVVPELEGEYGDNDTYYVLSFAYTTEDNPTYTYYSVVDFSMTDENAGGEYYVDLDKAGIVNSPLGMGSIGLGTTPTTDDLEYFVFDYVKKNGSYVWRSADYASSEYVNSPVFRIRGSQIYYGFSFVNSDWFKKFVFDREDNECNKLPIEVSSRKVTDITEKTVSDNNMVIVLGGDSSLCLGESYNDYSKGNSTTPANDFSIPVYKSLIGRIAQDKIPIVGDYKIIEAADQNKPLRGSFVHYLIRVLMLKIKDNDNDNSNDMDADPGFMSYYNAINGLDLSDLNNIFEPGDTSDVRIINRSMPSNNFHFVNGNAYVYNMQNRINHINVYQKFLNYFFCTMADISTPLPNSNEEPVSFSSEEGFKEVINDIRSENNFRKADTAAGSEPKLLYETLTEATAIRYIIGYAQKRAKSIKGTLRVLEIEPTNSFDLYIDDNETDEAGHPKDYNSYGMWGHSYTAKRGFEFGSMEKLDNNNWVLFRNGTYKRIEKSGNGYSNTGTGIVYRRKHWNEGGSVALRENVYERNSRNWNNWELKRNVETTRDLNRSPANKFIEFGNNIELTRMSVAEFVGHIEDLNSNYDVIYIGMNTQLLNVLNGENGEIKYWDENMTNMVYTSIGDKRRIWPVLASYENLLTSGTNDDEYAERYSGNDITDDGVKKLTQFVDAGFPVIFDDGFYKNANVAKGNREINTVKVDTVSYMYQFANNVKDKRSVYSVSDVYNENTSSGNEDSFFNWLLKLNKPEIVIKPGSKTAEAVKELNPDSQELSNTNFKMYGYELTQDAFDGQFHLEFEFSIRNLGAASSDSSYNARIYIDLNADGKYSESREKIDFTTLREDGYGISPSGDNLKIGKEYYAQCELPGTYDGVVPWRLVVSQKDHPERRTNVTGYYRLKKDTPAEINVLQLNQRGTRDKQPENQGSDSTWNMQSTSESGKFKELLDAISGYYKVNITTMDADVWERSVAGEIPIDNVDVNTYYSNLRNYNMLILGFADAYLGPKSENATAAIEKYIKSERSTMFTHDCTSFFNYDYFTNKTGWQGSDATLGGAENGGYIYHWGYYFNKHIRNIVGMDRYNVMNGEESEYHKYDIPYEPGSGIRSGEAGNSVVTNNPIVLNSKRGISNRDITNHTYLYNNYESDGNTIPDKKRYYNLKGINDGNGQDGGGSWQNDHINGNVVTQVNDGQITKFPFALHKSFPVAPTHSQYYQLDFNDDADKDGEKDIVVWYCISDAPNRSFDGNSNDNWIWGGDMYEMSPNDARNNYYIYNKGSITYSGVGHWKVVESDGNPSLKTKDRQGNYINANYTTGRYSMVDDKGLTDNTDELKLFINTMVAAYQRGIREPSIKVVRSYTDNAATSNLHLSYDKSYTENGILDSDVDLYFKASRSNIGNTDSNVRNNLKIRLYYEASREEAEADPNDRIVQLDPLSREYDIVDTNLDIDEPGNRHYYDDGNDSGIYGIEIPATSAPGVLSTIKSIGYMDSGNGLESAHVYKNDIDTQGGLNPRYGINEYLADDRIYKITFGGVNEIKAEGSEDLWYNYEDGYVPNVSANSIQERSLNNRRIILMITNDTYNTVSDIGREESSVQYVTLTRAKMFMLE